MLLGLAVFSKGSFHVNIGAFAGQNHLSFARFCFIGIIIGHSSQDIELVRIVDLLRGLCILTLCHIRDFCLLGLSRSAASLTALIRVRCIRTGNRYNDFSVATITAIPAIATVAAACATAASGHHGNSHCCRQQNGGCFFVQSHNTSLLFFCSEAPQKYASHPHLTPPPGILSTNLKNFVVLPGTGDRFLAI